MSKQTRRAFLENSMFAAAAAAAASSAASPRLMGAKKGSKSANERLRVAILGINGRGRSHRDAWLGRNDVEIAAIVDPDEAVGHEKGVEPVYKESGKRPAFYRDLRKALDDDSIDFVSVATPNHWHALASIWAVQAGKDVYCEKPVSHNVSEGRRIVQAARKYGKIVQTGTQGRSNEAVIQAVDFIRSGGVGDVNLARGLCYKRRKSIGSPGIYDVPQSVDYDVWTGPAQLKPLARPRLHYDWHWVWETGNGDLGNQGIHQMDIARWGLGVNDLGCTIDSYGGRLGYVDAGTTANTQVCNFDYGDKRLVFEVRGLETDGLRDVKIGVIFYGEDGYVISTSRYSRTTAFDLDGNVIKEFEGGGDHYGNFITAVRSRNVGDLNADIEEGHLSSALCHLGNVSYLLGEKVGIENISFGPSKPAEAEETFDRFQQHLSDNGVDPSQSKLRVGPMLTLDGDAEVFTGPLASQANPMLTRDYREPYVVPSEKNI